MIFQSHTAAMQHFLKIMRESSDILCVALIGMTFNIYLFMPYVPKRTFNKCLVILVPLTFVYGACFFFRVLCCRVGPGRSQYLCQERGLGHTSKWSFL